MKKLRVGVIGIGDISNVYLNNLKKYDAVEVVACASRGLEKAQRKAAEHGIPKAYASGMELIADPDIDLVLNLTTPQAHYVSMSRVLWWVMKGRAVAPPEMVFRTGVSTSI
mgnify:CR=1 FL=1